MNILMITPEFPPNYRGGLGKQVGELVKALSPNHTIAVVAPDLTEHSPGSQLWSINESEKVLPTIGLDPLSRINIALTNTINVALNSQRWDIVHAHDWVVAPAISSVLFNWDIPVITTFHSDNAGLLGGSESDRKRRLDWEKTIVNMSTAVTGVSNWLSEALKERYPKATVKHIPNGMQLSSRFRDLASVPDSHRVTFVGRLVPHKGVDDLLRAWSIVVKANPGARLDIIGDGFQRTELIGLSDSIGISSSVEFLGWRTPEEIRRHLTQTSIAVFPSREEAFGLAAAEAIALGVPVLLSDIPAFRELVPSDFGGFFDSGNTFDLAMKIPAHRPSVQELQQLADSISYRYGWSRVGRMYEMCYKGLHTNP